MRKFGNSLSILLLSAMFLGACTNKTRIGQISTSSSPSSSSSSTRASSSTSTTSSETTKVSGKDFSELNRGVQLESGQDTIDYAKMILGDKDWIVIEGNYTRTESIPYNLLQGNDGSLYWVYQNGEIYDKDNKLVHQP
ncbi:hypothetical protein NQZ89_00345 [Streptococcus suis]|uniref:hypothetical protein n=1 Tax=Streptococcus suis TaxID=1307 RepID=UPI000CF396B8|nr:hypothetical protein [Streptococcus suis]NQI33951.1 hypothetical protein [Streptococcus suis]NQM37788.1 hypothetical protein [Streptococcus suis]UUM62072.1 hypothetical protein NQZ89_00345 [Streptococcus suis]HEL2575407.1 hypothetical protein [Streptococcus suis]